jgi:hypothetical protein
LPQRKSIVETHEQRLIVAARDKENELKPQPSIRNEGYITSKNTTYNVKRPAGEVKESKRMRSTSATKKFSSNI